MSGTVTNLWAALLAPATAPAPRPWGKSLYGTGLYSRNYPTPGIEISGNCYARVPCTLEVDTDGIDLANVATLQWPMACGYWGLVDQVAIYDAPTGGNQIAEAPVTGGDVLINQYNRPRVPAGGLIINPSAPVAYSLDGFGTGAYATTLSGLSALLLLTFGPAVALCGGQPGDWAPAGPFGVV